MIKLRIDFLDDSGKKPAPVKKSGSNIASMFAKQVPIYYLIFIGSIFEWMVMRSPRLLASFWKFMLYFIIKHALKYSFLHQASKPKKVEEKPKTPDVSPGKENMENKIIEKHIVSSNFIAFWQFSIFNIHFLSVMYVCILSCIVCVWFPYSLLKREKVVPVTASSYWVNWSFFMVHFIFCSKACLLYQITFHLFYFCLIDRLKVLPV